MYVVKHVLVLGSEYDWCKNEMRISWKNNRIHKDMGYITKCMNDIEDNVGKKYEIFLWSWRKERVTHLQCKNIKYVHHVSYVSLTFICLYIGKKL